MNDLIERYVHQVGKYLPEKERDEVKNELRSLLQDQLEDRYKGHPTDEDVVELLTEFGEPRKMAASYGREQYLIGPDLYPAMLYVLQRGWVWVPIIVVLIRLLVAFIGGEPATLLSLFLGTLFAVLQAVFAYSGVVVIIFAIMQHTGFDLEKEVGPFNPLDLPPINDPAAVDRGEVAASIAFSTFGAFILFYFLQVGGLTLRFNPTEPADILPVPLNWLAVALGTTIVLLVLEVIALRRGRWSPLLLLVEMAVEVVSVLAAYHAFFVPLFGWLFERVPALANLPFAGSAPEIAAVFIGFVTLADTFAKLVKVAFGGRGNLPSISFQSQG